MNKLLSLIVLLGMSHLLYSQMQKSEAHRSFRVEAESIDKKVIEWRRHIHENPELSNREFKTAEYIADHLRSLGLKVTTGVAHTGVVGILETGRPGPVIGLRADIDGLPVKERADIPFASKAMGEYLGEEVNVMHACGHDTHVAMLMGAASILSSAKDELNGTIKFVFQPAEEGAPPGENGGARMMIEEGVLENPNVDVMFGLHINSQTEVGKVRYKPGGAMAAADIYSIKVKGVQSHGSQPWSGVDPIVTASQIIMGLQTIISRQTDLSNEAAVISVGKFTAGVRNNIIPEEAELVGTIRTLDVKMQDLIHEKIRTTAINIAKAQGAEAEVNIRKGVPVTYNDPNLTNQMLPTLERVFGNDNVVLSKAIMGAEDFSFYANRVPSLFLFVGGMPKGKNPKDAAPHHTPDFFIDDSGLKHGVELLCSLTWEYMHDKPQ